MTSKITENGPIDSRIGIDKKIIEAEELKLP